MSENDGFTMGFFTCLKNQRFVFKDGPENVLALSRATFGSFWWYFGSSLGFLDRPNRASSFALEFVWASFARFLLPSMAWGASMSFMFYLCSVPLGVDCELQN